MPQTFAMYHPLKVKQVTRLTAKSVVIDFEIPKSLETAFQYQAGQYVSLEETIAGDKIRRSYSVCTAPSENRLAVGIKQIPNGVFSSFANQDIKAGSILSVAQPDGRFVVNRFSENSSYAAVAAGSGITPIMSLAKQVLHQTNSSIFYLVYGNKSVEDEMFKDEIDALTLAYPNRFVVLRTYSQKRHENADFGRIGTSILERLVQLSGLRCQQYFLCGPEAMIKHVSGLLQKKGVLSDAIQYELFSTSKSSVTEVDKPLNFQMKLTCDDVSYELEGGAGKTILDAALQNKIDVPYSCQGGVCSSCIARVTKGAAQMATNQILTDGEIEEGLVLSCQAHPTTQVIEVDFDDV